MCAPGVAALNRFLWVLLKGKKTADEYTFLKRSEVTIFTELDLLKAEIVRLHFA